jgi:hypothetical protein
MDAPELEIGRWYRIVYRIEGIHNVPRVAVMQYLGTQARGPLTELIFNLRPLAGTQSLEPRWLIGITPASENKPMMPQKLR